MKFTIYRVGEFKYANGNVGKIGCTKRPLSRFKSYSELVIDILEVFESDSEIEAGEIERRWQLKYGYRANDNHYQNNKDAGCAAARANRVRKVGFFRTSKANARKNGLLVAALNRANKKGAYFDSKIQSINGKKGGAKTAIWMKANGKGFYDRKLCSMAGKKGGAVTSAKIHKCPNCGKEGQGIGMFRWHFDACRGEQKL